MPDVDVSNNYSPSPFTEGLNGAASSPVKEEEVRAFIKDSAEGLIEDLQAYTAHVSENYTPGDGQVMSRVLRLLIEMVKVYQDLAIAQADHLNLLVRYQHAYTALQGQIIIITADGKTPLSKKDEGDKQDIATARNFMNQRLQNWAGNLQNLRGVVESDAKKMQTNVNTTNQAVNQMMDLFTILVRQINELASIICR